MRVRVCAYTYVYRWGVSRKLATSVNQNFDHDGCAQMYSNYIAKVLLNNRPKTVLKYFSSLNNYRLAKICGYVWDIPQHVHH